MFDLTPFVEDIGGRGDSPTVYVPPIILDVLPVLLTIPADSPPKIVKVLFLKIIGSAPLLYIPIFLALPSPLILNIALLLCKEPPFTTTPAFFSVPILNVVWLSPSFDKVKTPLVTTAPLLLLGAVPTLSILKVVPFISKSRSVLTNVWTGVWLYAPTPEPILVPVIVIVLAPLVEPVTIALPAPPPLGSYLYIV